MYVIIDYGMGNLFSVEQAFKRLGITPFITSSPEDLQNASVLVLPGVGAFPDAVKELKAKGLFEAIQEKVAEGTPLLGICLGMQLLYESSDEMELTDGFGFLQGHIRKFSGQMEDGSTYKVPHMGWNTLCATEEGSEFKSFNDKYVYYVHSFFASDCKKDELIAKSSYGGVNVPGVVGKGNIIGMQFHPEKSGDIGSNLLQFVCEKFEKEKRELSL